MRKKLVTVLLLAVLSLSIGGVLTATTKAATKEDIEASGATAVAHLAIVQSSDGSWGSANPIATTGLVLLKFVVRAQELDLDPFDNDPLSPTYFEYADNTIAGFDYLLGSAYDVPISLQTHGDPDTNGNGKGITFGYGQVYYSGIALTAIAICGHPDDRSATIGTLGLLTYREIAQDIADWLYYAQGDLGNDRGGFNYDALDNVEERTDNSNGGYAYLGIAFAEDPPFNCVVPDWVRQELNIYIDYIQNDVNGDTNDGGSGYDGPDNWVNILKTGNLIFEMAFYGDTPDTPRVQDAVDYLERHWQDPNVDPGWGYSLPTADYQAKFLVEKGLTYMGIKELDTDGDGDKEDWFNQEPPAIPPQDFASVIVQQQLPSGAWPTSQWDYEPGSILSTAWAVLTLERFAPPPQPILAYVDLKPGSWPNPIEIVSKGVLPVAICGTEDFDVRTIDPSTVKIYIEGNEEGVSPIRWSYEDVATPYTGPPEGGHALRRDGYLDLVFHFDTKAVVALDLASHVGETIPLIVRGNLREADGGTAIQGQDYARIMASAPKNAL
jgi:hypothetical protein